MGDKSVSTNFLISKSVSTNAGVNNITRRVGCVQVLLFICRSEIFIKCIKWNFKKLIFLFLDAEAKHNCWRDNSFSAFGNRIIVYIIILKHNSVE